MSRRRELPWKQLKAAALSRSGTMTPPAKGRNSGQWTEARYRQFVKGGLRQLSRRWPPISKARARARISRGIYLCALCHLHVPASVRIDGERKPNIYVDHIEPVVPLTGWTTWDDIIARMFVEVDGLQVLCGPCHREKTEAERRERKRASAKALANGKKGA